jgi:hypothetical protein
MRPLETDPAVEVFECATWDDFRKALVREKFNDDAEVTLWRGQGDRRWPLASSLDRTLLDPTTDRTRLTETEIIEYRKMRSALRATFADELIGLGLSIGGSADERLEALGRHYGLLTPLLDWTQKPFIGAFFAASDLLERQRRLKRSSVRTEKVPDLEATVFELDLIPAVKDAGLRYYPGRAFPGLKRLHAQYGALTSLPDNKGFLDVEDFVKTMSKAQIPCLTKYHLSAHAAYECVEDLRDHGLSFRTLFPDEEGAAREANWSAGTSVMHLMRELKDILKNK